MIGVNDMTQTNDVKSCEKCYRFTTWCKGNMRDKACKAPKYSYYRWNGK